MLNSVDRRVIIRTIMIYAAVIFIVIYGFAAFNKISFVAANPQIKALIALLMVVAISYAQIPTEITFLICGILGSFIMGIPLSRYIDFLYKQASSTSILMIAVSGAVVAVLARGDLLDKIRNTDGLKYPDRYSDLQHQVAIFCLFDRLQAMIVRIGKKKLLAALFFLFQNMLLFVSSVVAASTFSAMLKTGKKQSSEQNAYTDAGILCMCVSGCLLLFFFMKSPWWLFFTGFEKYLGVHIQFPLAALIYGFFSFVHGYYLLLKAKLFTPTEAEEKHQSHPLAQRHFVMFIGLITVFLVFTLTFYIRTTPPQADNLPDTTIKLVAQKNARTESNPLRLTAPKGAGFPANVKFIAQEHKGSIEAPTIKLFAQKDAKTAPVPITFSAQKRDGNITPTITLVAEKDLAASRKIQKDAAADKVNKNIITILILILAAIISATVITRNIMQKTHLVQPQHNTFSDLHQLILGDPKGNSGIRSIVGLLILIITILSFKDMVKECVDSGSKNLPNIVHAAGTSLISTEGLIALAGCIITLAVVYVIGRILGSNFGAFSIGMIIFNIVAGKMFYLDHNLANLLNRWMMEGLIMVSTFSNQVSFKSSNATAINKTEDPRKIQQEAWKVKSFFGQRAFTVQMIAMLICVVLSGVFTVIGIK